MQKLLPLALVALGLTAGCASSGAAPTPERVVMIDETTGTSIRSVNDRSGPTTSLSEPADKVFDAVTIVFALLKVPRTVASSNTGEQGNTKFAMSRSFNGRPVSTYLSCGDDPLAGSNADSYPVTAALVTRVRPNGVGSSLETKLTGTLFKPNANTGGIYCASTGALELKIAQMVAAQLKQ